MTWTAALLEILAAARAGGATEDAAPDAAGAYPHAVVTLVTHSSPGGGSDVFRRSHWRAGGADPSLAAAIAEWADGLERNTEAVRPPWA